MLISYLGVFISISFRQRANRMGIATPKKETANKTWSDDDLESALEALRRREISANKAAKIYKIPSSVSLVLPMLFPLKFYFSQILEENQKEYSQK